MTRLHADAGAGTLLVLTLTVALLAAGLAATTLAAAVALRHHGSVAADAAALAAAARADDGQTPACGLAARVAVADGAVLRACSLTGATAEVSVEVEPPLWLRWAGPVHVRARAGPAQTYLEENASVGTPS